MQTATKATLENVLKADPEVTPEQANAILSACQRPTRKRETIPLKIVCQLLEMSVPSVYRLIRLGLIDQIKITSRKIRYDREQVERIAYNGAPTAKEI